VLNAVKLPAGLSGFDYLRRRRLRILAQRRADFLRKRDWLQALCRDAGHIDSGAYQRLAVAPDLLRERELRAAHSCHRGTDRYQIVEQGWFHISDLQLPD